MTRAELVARTRPVCMLAQSLTEGTAAADEVAALTARLDGPLRVALAGRVKAGKSTLLNALVGERLAPTDAGECTRLISWYREGLGYEVHARLRDGTRRELPFRRDGGALAITFDGLTTGEIDHLEVSWPSSSLREVTLVDTPGLGASSGLGAVTTTYLTPEDGYGQADAVIYLMRHLHADDAGFLETFADRTIANASPVNAVAVLSRADEIGVGRPDAMDAAARIAARYRRDPRVRALTVTVLPVAGLIAETGLTLTHDEFAAIATLARLPDAELVDLLLSADRVVAAEHTPLAPPARQALLDRLGMYGLRRAVEEVRSGRVTTSSELARRLVDCSGLAPLQSLIRGHFMTRATALKVRSVLTGLRQVAGRLADTDPAGARTLQTAIEQAESSAHELAELRLLHLVLAGVATLDEDEVDEVRRVTTGTARARLGLPPDASADDCQQQALAAIDRWRQRASSPLMDPATREACGVLARSYEGLYVDVAGTARPGTEGKVTG